MWAVRSGCRRSRARCSRTASPISPPSARDADSDCYFNSGVGALALAAPQTIVRLIKSNPDGAYTVTFPGKAPEIVAPPTDAEIAAYTDADDGVWFNVLEKAYAKIRKIDPKLATAEPLDAATLIGGSEGGVMALVSGHAVKFTRFPLLSHQDPDQKFLDEVRKDLADAFRDHRGVVTAKFHHAFAVVAYEPQSDTVTIHNPYDGNGFEMLTNGELSLSSGGFLSVSSEKFVENFKSMSVEQTTLAPRLTSGRRNAMGLRISSPKAARWPGHGEARCEAEIHSHGRRPISTDVMAGPVPAIHAVELGRNPKDYLDAMRMRQCEPSKVRVLRDGVDGRDRPGHDKSGYQAKHPMASAWLGLARDAAASCRRALALPLLAAVPAFAADAPSPSRLVAEMHGPDGAALCLAVDVKKPLQGPFTVQPSNSKAKPHVAEGPFYPVVAASCEALGESAAALWTAGLDHELQANVNGRPLCLSMRPMGAFQPLIDPFLAAFGAAEPNSPFAYLAGDLKPGGAVNARRADFAPELVVGACGASDAMDAWVYDEPSGTISGPAGPSWRRPCVTIHLDRSVKTDQAAPGTPAWAAYCRDSPDTPDENIDALDRALLPLSQRWRLETTSDAPPTYARRDPADYFSGRGGLPIAGPMGRCLTADPGKNALFTADCDGRVEQDWKYVDNQVRLGAKDLCLTAAADGSAALGPCGSARNQVWAYTVRDGAANKQWLREESFGELRPVDAPSKCLGVVKDPFADPQLALNPLGVLDCAASEPRRISWFVATNVQTVRIALVRFGHGSEHTPLPKLSDDSVKAAFQLETERLSQQFRRLGVRFVFDQQHDFRRVEDPIADNPADGRALAQALTKLGASDFYGKIMVALTERGTPGGTTALNVEYEPERIADPISGARFDYARWKQDAPIVIDKAGLPALSNFIDFGPGVVNLDTRAALRQAQEFGHYFGLLALNVEPAPADAPATPHWRAWIDAGAPPCGNLASLTLNGKTFLPDRTNAGARGDARSAAPRAR